jgi:hypothetical protein
MENDSAEFLEGFSNSPRNLNKKVRLTGPDFLNGIDG